MSRAAPRNQQRPALSVTASPWPNVSRAPARASQRACFGPWTTDKRPTSVLVDVPATGNNVVVLSLRGCTVDVARASGGHAYFYDLDDGTYYAHDTEGAGAWRVVIAGAAVTVTALSSGSALGLRGDGRLTFGAPITGTRLVTLGVTGTL